MGPRIVSIAPGCIECFWCQQLAGDIFIHGKVGTEISGTIRQDGITSDNRREKSPLDNAKITAHESVFLQFIADGCPVHVIRLDGEWAEFGIADPAIGA